MPILCSHLNAINQCSICDVLSQTVLRPGRKATKLIKQHSHIKQWEWEKHLHRNSGMVAYSLSYLYGCTCTCLWGCAGLHGTSYMGRRSLSGQGVRGLAGHPRLQVRSPAIVNSTLDFALIPIDNATWFLFCTGNGNLMKMVKTAVWPATTRVSPQIGWFCAPPPKQASSHISDYLLNVHMWTS